MTIYRCLLLTIIMGSAAAVCTAQDKVDEVGPGFRAFVVKEPRFTLESVHNRQGKMPDLVAEHGLNPVIAVFAKTMPTTPDSPLLQVMRKQDELQPKYKHRKLGTYLVFLTLKDEYRKADKDNTRDARVAEVEQFVSGSKPEKTTVAIAESTVVPNTEPLVPAQVTAMGIGAEDDLVVIFYNQLRVVKRWKYKAGAGPSAADLAELSSLVEKTLPRKK